MIHFAQRRLAHFGLSNDLDNDANDLFQQAIYAVLKGLDGKEGRKPNPQDVENEVSFQNYLRGVINSIAEGWARTYHREHKNEHCSLDLIQESIADVPDGHIEYQDLKIQLFSRLRRQVPARLLSTVDAWEKAPDGRIPCVVSRKHVGAVRRIAQQIARDLEKPGRSHPAKDQVAPHDRQASTSSPASVVEGFW